MWHRYFAYGSNLHPGRLGARVTITADLGAVALPGWRLHFHKRGADGSAKCNLVRGTPDFTVWGAVYLLDAAARARLDEIEGVGRGYSIETCLLPQGEAYFYIAESSYIDDTLVAFDWYVELVLAGARWRAFPRDYIAALEATPRVSDPDIERTARNLVVLRDSAPTML